MCFLIVMVAEHKSGHAELNYPQGHALLLPAFPSIWISLKINLKWEVERMGTKKTYTKLYDHILHKPRTTALLCLLRGCAVLWWSIFPWPLNVIQSKLNTSSSEPKRFKSISHRGEGLSLYKTWSCPLWTECSSANVVFVTAEHKVQFNSRMTSHPLKWMGGRPPLHHRDSCANRICNPILACVEQH